MGSRKPYLLSCDKLSRRTQFSINILKKVGFEVEVFPVIENPDKVLSNKNSMMMIYKKISEGDDQWAYVFEDDINILENIHLDEIIKYENIFPFFLFRSV